MNTSNLIPQAHRLSVDEASKGGIASGQSRRERKQLREVICTILENDFEIEGHSFDGRTAVCLALVKRALNGDVRAFEAIRDQLGEKPAERVQVTEIDPATRARVEAALASE